MRNELKTLMTWDPWHTGEARQPDQFAQLQMFGEPVITDKLLKSITLRLHWQCDVKHNETQRVRLCCGGSKCALSISPAPSLCTEHPMQRLFCAIAAQLDENVCEGDAKDACTHCPGSDIKTHTMINNACTVLTPTTKGTTNVEGTARQP